MPEGQQDHGEVAVTVAVAPRGFDQRLDLADGEVLPGPHVRVLAPPRNSPQERGVRRPACAEQRQHGSVVAAVEVSIRLRSPAMRSAKAEDEAVSMNVTRHSLPSSLLAAAILLPAASGSAQPQQVAYPEVNVVLENPYKPDAAFDKMIGAFLDAVQRKDIAALTTLVAPTFVWTVNDHLADELDLGRNAIHNFKVAFGFRGVGEDVDGDVDDGPYWEVLTAFAEDPSFYIANGAGTLVCGPMSAQVVDDNAFDRARRKIDAIDEPVEWYFTLAAETPVARAPGDASTPVCQGRGHRDAAAQRLSTGEGRRTAAGTNSFRGASAVRPDGLGAG